MFGFVPGALGPVGFRTGQDAVALVLDASLAGCKAPLLCGGGSVGVVYAVSVAELSGSLGARVARIADRTTRRR